MSPTWMRHDTWRISADLQNSQWTTVSKNDGLEPNTGSIDEVLLLTDMQKEDLAILATDVQSKSVLESLDTFTIAGEKDKWSGLRHASTCARTVVSSSKVNLTCWSGCKVRDLEITFCDYYYQRMCGIERWTTRGPFNRSILQWPVQCIARTRTCCATIVDKTKYP